MPAFADRRRHVRVHVQVRIEALDPGTGRRFVLSTVDLSAGGALCRALVGLPAGAALEGHVLLPVSEGGRDDESRLPFRGRVLRRAESVGTLAAVVAFEEMAEVDRDEISRFLLDSMADDCVVAGRGEAVAR